MGKNLTEIAQQLKNPEKKEKQKKDSSKPNPKSVKDKVQLIYAFNGVGKTRLSGEFKQLIAPKNDNAEEMEHFTKFLYYNAFTEDLFYWDNDLDGDAKRKLKIHPNAFTKWVLEDQGQDQNIIQDFQRYTNDKLTPKFNPEYQEGGKTIPAFSEVTFSLECGTNEHIDHIKISKGEESNFIWCIFYSLLSQVVVVLNMAEPADRETDKFNHLEYVFIDDPVTSLDENHLIELAVNLAELIKTSSSDIKFIITTHNPLFYNVMYNEFQNSGGDENAYRPKHCKKYILGKLEDGSYAINELSSDSPFAYHIYLLFLLKKAIQDDQIQKYHFNFLRNILEKTSTFLGYAHWEDLLPDDTVNVKAAYAKRILNFSSHSKFSGEEVPIIKEEDKLVLKFLVNKISQDYFNPNIGKKDSISEENNVQK